MTKGDGDWERILVGWRTGLCSCVVDQVVKLCAYCVAVGQAEGQRSSFQVYCLGGRRKMVDAGQGGERRGAESLEAL